MFSSEPGRLGHVVRHFSVVGTFFVTGRVAHFSHHNPFTRRSARHHAPFPMTVVHRRRHHPRVPHALRRLVSQARRSLVSGQLLGGHWSVPRRSLVTGRHLGGHWSLVRHAAVTGHWSDTRRSLVIGQTRVGHWSVVSHSAVTGQSLGGHWSLVGTSAVTGHWSATRRSLVSPSAGTGHWSAPRRSLVSPSAVIALVSSAAVIGQ